MGSVTFPTRLGGSGVTISDDADPNTGLLNGGHRDRFVPGLQGAVDMASYVYRYAAKIDGAAEDAERAENARAIVEAYADTLRTQVQHELFKEATLNLDFGRGYYTQDTGELLETTDASLIVNVVRSTPKWVFSPSGYLREIPINQLAREWDVATGKPLGVLIEGAATNRFPYSENFSEWRTTSATAQTSTMTTPRIGVTAFYLQEASGSDAHSVSVTALSAEPETWYCRSVFAKSDGSGRMLYLETDGFSEWESPGGIVFNLESGSIHIDDPSVPRRGITDAGGGWYRCWIASKTVKNLSSGSVFCDIAIHDGVAQQYAGNGQSGVYIFGAQFEKGVAPTSYIPTQGTAATRQADSVTVPQRGWFNAESGTLLITSNAVSAPDQNRRPGGFYASARNRYHWVVGNTSDAYALLLDVKNTLRGPAPDGNFMTRSLGYNNGVLSSATDGGAYEARRVLNAYRWPSGVQLDIGTYAGSGDFINGHIKSLRYIPRHLTQSESEAATL